MPYPGVEDAQELHNSRTGVAFGRHGVRTFERNFLVKTSISTYGPNEICSANNLPVPYEQYDMPEGVDVDVNAVCIELSARLIPQAEEDNRFWWIVTAKYGTDTPPEGIPAVTNLGGETVGSQHYPWEEPILVKYESEVIQRAPSQDLIGQSYWNSANQPFTPPYTQEVARRILIIARNQETFNFDAADLYSFAVNSDEFNPPGGTVDPGCAQCFPIHGEMLSRGLVNYWRVTYRIRIGAWIWNPDTQRVERETFSPVRLLDAGTMRLQVVPLLPGLNTPVPIIGPNGFPISQPVPLSGGQPKPAVGGIIDPTWLTFFPFPDEPFTPILTTGIG